MSNITFGQFAWGIIINISSHVLIKSVEPFLPKHYLEWLAMNNIKMYLYYSGIITTTLTAIILYFLSFKVIAFLLYVPVAFIPLIVYGLISYKNKETIIHKCGGIRKYITNKFHFSFRDYIINVFNNGYYRIDLDINNNTPFPFKVDYIDLLIFQSNNTNGDICCMANTTIDKLCEKDTRIFRPYSINPIVFEGNMKDISCYRSVDYIKVKPILYYNGVQVPIIDRPYYMMINYLP